MNDASFDSILRITKQIDDRYFRREGKYGDIKPIKKTPKLFIGAVSLWIIAALLALAYKYINANEIIKLISLLSLIISQVLISIYIIMPVFSIFKTSMAQKLNNNIRNASYVENRYIKLLNSKSSESLNFMKMQFQAEIDRATSRVHILVGVVEKFGILPSIFAATITISKFESTPPDWLLVLLYSYPVIYLISVSLIEKTQRLNKMRSLLEFVIEKKST